MKYSNIYSTKIIKLVGLLVLTVFLESCVGGSGGGAFEEYGGIDPALGE